MRYVNFATAALLALIALQALAQAPSGANPSTGARPGHDPGTGESLPRHPTRRATSGPPIRAPPSRPPCRRRQSAKLRRTQDYLKAARAALVAGHTGQAQQSLEMAETRALDRSVAPGQTTAPSDSQLVSRIRDARHALGSGDRTHAIQLIDLALSS